MSNTHPRSIWENIKIIIQSITDAMVSSTAAIGKGAQIADSLANSGLLMAQSNERLVEIGTTGKEQRQIEELKKEFPDLDFGNFETTE